MTEERNIIQASCYSRGLIGMQFLRYKVPASELPLPGRESTQSEYSIGEAAYFGLDGPARFKIE